MARLARVVIPGVSHHVTQRGNRRQQVFFSDGDYRLYLSLLNEWSDKEGLSVQVYCLMPNHVHLIVVPSTEKSLHRCIKEVHRRYSCHVNLRENWRGYLWQGRFSSFPMDEPYLLHAVGYVEDNPVRARLSSKAEEWQWSSCRHRIDSSTSPVRLSPIVPTGASSPRDISDFGEKMRGHERTGRPLAELGFIRELEHRIQRPLLPQKPGPKPKQTTLIK